jgi:cell division septum initiation protein DivIVA
VGEDAAEKETTRSLDSPSVIQERGFDPNQADTFAHMVAKRLAALQIRNGELQAIVDRHAQESKAIDVFHHWGDETRRLFDTARETVASVTADSAEQARVTIQEAEHEAAALRAETERECAAMRADAQLIHDTTKANAEAMIQDAQAEVARIVEAGQRERRIIGADLASARNRLIELQTNRATVTAALARIQSMIGGIVPTHETATERASELGHDHVLLGDR